MVLRKQQHFADDLRRPGVVVGERQEEPAARLRLDGDDAQRTARLAMHDAATQVQRILAELAQDEYMRALDLVVTYTRRGQRLHLFSRVERWRGVERSRVVGSSPISWLST